jgi:arylsulfatase A-like enzyme
MPTVFKKKSGSNPKVTKEFRLSLLLIVCVFATSALAQTAPPNIVVILADDLGYGDVGFNGCQDIPTPNIDSLAANGVRCLNGYATHPFCAPSRAGLLTGRYQQRFGFENNFDNDANNPRLGIPSDELLISELLRPHGYVCGAIGKWHVGSATNLHPIARGFDSFYGFLGPESDYFNAQLLRDETHVVESEYLTDGFSREAESFINTHAAQPFLLYLAYNAPHVPYEVTQNYLDRVAYITDANRRTLAAMIVALDDGVGRVLQALQAQNLLEKTLIIFLSDNGAPGHNVISNYPLRGYKLDTLEGGIRVPFAVQWTGRLPANVVYDGLISALDIVPTAAAAAGVSLPADGVYDGLDIVPFLADEQAPPERILCWRWFGLGQNGPPGSQDTINAVRKGPLKLVTERALTGQPPALYNLTNDIGETTNIAASQPEDVTSLQTAYDQWRLDTLPPRWQMNSSFPTSLVIAGDWDGYNKNDSSPPWALTRISAPGIPATPDGYNWYTNVIHVATTGGDTLPGVHSFVFVGGKTWEEQWGGVSINIDNTTTIPYYSGPSIGPTNTISLEDGYYYSFRVLDPGRISTADLIVAILKTSAPPVSVSRSGQTPAEPTPHDPITVSIATSQAKSMEERIYLRWSTDLFITSDLIEAEGSGVSYSATIPPQPARTLVLYTIITSTADLSAYSTSGVIDSLILATTDVFNAVPPIPPAITTQPANKTVTVGRTAKFSVKATGTKPLGYQWKKNGANIAGATRPSYTTPPTTLGDNGALFAVVVSDRAGSVTSNNATLTVNP